MKAPTQCLSTELLVRMSEILKVLAHPHRLKIVEILEREQEAPVHRMMEGLDLPQPVVSQHLNQMRRVGVVDKVRNGKEVWYHLSDNSALTILDCIRRKHGVCP